VGRDPGKLRIAFHPGTLLGREVDPQHANAVTQVAAQLAALGHHVEPAAPAIDREALVRAYLVQIATGVAAEVHEFSQLAGREPSPDLFEPETWFMNLVGRATGAVELLESRTAVQLAGRITAAFHERYDLFLCPTTAFPQIHIGELALGAGQKIGLRVLQKAPVGAVLHQVMNILAPNMLERTPNTQLFNQTGQPAISLPLARAADGMPIGLQFAAAMGREDLLIRIAAQLEEAHPWRSMRPSVHA
jgi:amidase